MLDLACYALFCSAAALLAMRLSSFSFRISQAFSAFAFKLRFSVLRFRFGFRFSNSF